MPHLSDFVLQEWFPDKNTTLNVKPEIQDVSKTSRWRHWCQYKVTVLHIEINDKIVVSHLLFDNRYYSVKIKGTIYKIIDIIYNWRLEIKHRI